MNDLIQYARKVEGDMYEAAKDKVYESCTIACSLLCRVAKPSCQIHAVYFIIIIVIIKEHL